MNTKQQVETLAHFNKNAANWKKKASSDSVDTVNMIKQRNDFVLTVIDGRKSCHRMLDIGCGTGDLVCAAAERGLEAVGVDFAPEMIRTAQKNAAKSEGAIKFECCSIFDFPIQKNSYDVMSANGVIEYISYSELDRLLDVARVGLKKGGSLVLGSRNRLFNVNSLNSYTEQEIAEGHMNALLREAIHLASMRQSDTSKLHTLKTAPLQKAGKKHTKTDIEVTTRYQFTPAQLAAIVHKKGFEPLEIGAIHIHASPSTFKARQPKIHTGISTFLQQFASDVSLIPQSSSFMMHCKKR